MNLSQLDQLSFLRRNRLPVILQSEAAECGLACLAMVATYWGHRIDIAAIRNRYSVSLKGTTLAALITVARGMKLQTRPLKLDMHHLRNLQLPCILHWNLNHFVVLKSLTINEAIIHDPAIGERRVGLADVSNHFSGIALELHPTSDFKKKKKYEKFRFFH